MASTRLAAFALVIASAPLIAVSERPLPIFEDDSAVALKLEAPFNDLFEHARANPDYLVKGTLSYSQNGREFTIEGVSIGLRGHTSVRESECAFPKLKIDLPPEEHPTAGSLFAGLKAIKIGTHCGDAPGDSLTAKYGRLPNETAPLRETAVYRLLGALDVPTLKARLARISYVYKDAQPGRTPDQQKPLVRHAMLLETSGVTLKRLGADAEIGAEEFTNARERFTPEDTATLAFGEALIGNFDWCVRMFRGDAYRCDAQHPLWNVSAIVGADGQARPVMYDFDVSGMVVGRHRWFKDVLTASFDGHESPIDVEVLSQVQRTRTLFSRDVLDSVRRRFVQRKAAAYRVAESASLDAQGRRLMTQYLDAFYAAIASDDRFYRPVVSVKGTVAYTDAQGTTAVCRASGAVPVGTLVSEPIEKRDQRVKVMLLDTLWHWAPPIKCDAVHDAPVWIDAAAISADYPSSRTARE